LAKASLFKKYFYFVFTTPSCHPAPPDNNDDSNMLSELTISDVDVLNVLLNLDTTKAMGSDGNPSIVLQRCATVFYQPLSHLFNLTLQVSYLPSEWKIHKIIPIFKSAGDPTSVKNYHPISLLSNTKSL